MRDKNKLKVAGGLKENGIVIGNSFDKYGSRNPIVRQMMKGYERSLDEFILMANPASIHEVGCGEGYWTLKWLEKGFNARGTDFSKTVIEMARANAVKMLPADRFSPRDIYNLDPTTDKAELVVCCQVLEHLERPDEALKSLQQVASPYLIACVPNEPLWSFLNVARGKYWRDFGNTPGHIQRWSTLGFEKLVSTYFTVIKVNTPLPWTMLFVKNKKSDRP